MTGRSDHLPIPTHTSLHVPCYATKNVCDSCIASAQGPRTHWGSSRSGRIKSSMRETHTHCNSLIIYRLAYHAKPCLARGRRLCIRVLPLVPCTLTASAVLVSRSSSSAPLHAMCIGCTFGASQEIPTLQFPCTPCTLTAPSVLVSKSSRCSFAAQQCQILTLYIDCIFGASQQILTLQLPCTPCTLTAPSVLVSKSSRCSFAARHVH